MGGEQQPKDRILWCAHNDQLPESEYRNRFPPIAAVRPCFVRCQKCKTEIDVAFQWLELHAENNETIYDIDCPHCWRTNAFTAKSTVQRLVQFRRRCAKWINPPVSKPGRVTPSLRFKVLERDAFKCKYCGAKSQSTSLHIDHKIPISDGGTNEMENLVTACAECNLGKGKSSVDLY